MDHTHIVQAGDLDRYAPTRNSQAIIPELIYWLVKQSCPDPSVCRIPYGNAVNQPGWDGRVETDDGFREFVPKGKSYWEIGTGDDPQGKATEDFKKRTAEIDSIARADSSFVFVTPRSSGSGGWNEPEQTKWLERRKDKGWKLIRIIDGVKLADWLREFPAIGKWMATKIPLTANLGGLSTATEHWDNLISECPAEDPPFPPKLFTIGRTAACEALQALFEGKTQVLMLFAESPQDVADFVSAFLAGLAPDISRTFSNRCLYINDEQAWRSIVETRSPHVLVADPRLGLETDEGAVLQTIARRRGHAVIVPLCGAWSGDSPQIIKLRSPSQSQIESVLRESDFTDIRAKELGKIGGDRISALRRHLRGYGTLPPYATWENATLIAQAGLVGKWAGSNPADRSALEIFLGKTYGEWIEVLRTDTLRSDSPLIQHDEKWRLVARGEAWSSLGSRITDSDLDRFQEMAVSVLSERDPKFDLPKEERYAAGIHGKLLTHSNLIRNGIAETLALMGSRGKALSSCSDGKAEDTARLTVRKLLNKANWERWASLDSLMPLLAEAAPDEFLDAVESILVDLYSTPFHRIFTEEGDGFTGSNYMSGLLWALETLAWNPDFLSRVSVILADIASFDPGGKWTNRPSNSLIDIFLPWHVQTTAPFEKRKSAVEAVIREQPSVGWNLLLALLPHDHGVTSGCHRPVWRDFIPRDWKGEVLNTEYREQITAYTDLAVTLAKDDSEKLCELIKRLADLPETAHECLLEHLTTHAVVSLPEQKRLPLWETLDELVRQHRRFSDADWALPKDAISKIAETAQALAPTSPALKYHHLFSGRDYDLYDEMGNYEEQRKRLDKARQDAIAEILGAGGIEAALKFASNVAAPYEVGRALGAITSDEIESSILPSMLDAADNTSAQVVAGFIWARFWNRKIEWVDAVLERNWPVEHRAKLLTLLPFQDEIWKRASTHLTATHEALYWKNARVNPYGPDRDLTIAIKKLLEYGREGAAVMCVAQTTDDKSRFDDSLAIHALLAVLASKHGVKELDNHRTVALIKHLQSSETSDKDALFKIEWNFLPWLGRFSSGSPVTLEKRLASDPAFFAEVIGLIFHSKNIRKEDRKEPGEHQKNLAKNAYKLLREWKHCPGKQDDGSFSVEAFKAWLKEARRLTEESGHEKIAQIQIGHVLTYAPLDPTGLWIHEAVAASLNARDTGEMRSGFTSQLFNSRGVFTFTHGKVERELAKENREKADALDAKGYTRFATAMREFAEQYDRQAQREEKRDAFED
ncbi:MAG: hypothetical protein ACO1QS_17230 [Verrucomicrobiota bacterium]